MDDEEEGWEGDALNEAAAAGAARAAATASVGGEGSKGERTAERERSEPWSGEVMATLEGRGLEQCLNRLPKGKEELPRRVAGVLGQFVPARVGLTREQWAERVLETWF
jgi:hypothetical protein